MPHGPSLAQSSCDEAALECERVGVVCVHVCVSVPSVPLKQGREGTWTQFVPCDVYST